MKNEFKVFVVEMFKGFDVVDIITTSDLSQFEGNKLTKADWADYDEEADAIVFDFDFAIIDGNDDCVVYFVKQI
jgi:hypothetical protein